MSASISTTGRSSRQILEQAWDVAIDSNSSTVRIHQGLDIYQKSLVHDLTPLEAAWLEIITNAARRMVDLNIDFAAAVRLGAPRPAAKARALQAAMINSNDNRPGPKPSTKVVLGELGWGRGFLAKKIAAESAVRALNTRRCDTLADHLGCN